MLAPGIASHAVDDGCDAVRFALGTRKRPEEKGDDGTLGSFVGGLAGQSRVGL